MLALTTTAIGDRYPIGDMLLVNLFKTSSLGRHIFNCFLGKIFRFDDNSVPKGSVVTFDLLW